MVHQKVEALADPKNENDLLDIEVQKMKVLLRHLLDVYNCRSERLMQTDQF